MIADDYFDAPAMKLRSLKTLSAQVPVSLHGVALGMASTIPVDRRRLEKLARLLDLVPSESWSEHLAFVRAGGNEIGHLAMPPRSAASADGAVRNLAAAFALTGRRPLVENIATLVEPPGSSLSEPDWIVRILKDSGCGMLLDLHNLHANAVNFGYDARAFLRKLPPGALSAVHLSGGKWIEDGGARRLLDDHLHDPPDEVYELLEETAALAEKPLTVILERDGRYPSMAELLGQMEQARAALARGRARVGVPA